MAEQVRIYQHRDSEGNAVANRTPERAVYDENGKTLDVKLKGLGIDKIETAQNEALTLIEEAKDSAVEEVQELLPTLEKKIIGDKTVVSNGFDYSFVQLGSFATYSELKTTLDTLHSTNNSAQVIGNFRATLNGNLLFITNYVRSWSSEEFIQYIEGTVKLSEDGSLAVTTDVNKFVRKYSSGAWTAWAVDAGQYATQEQVAELDKKLNFQLPAIEEAKNEAINAINQNEQSAISNFNAQRVTPEMLSESTKQLIEASGGGTITNLADDEDIQSVDDGTGTNVLKLADRAYNAENFSGKGYKILRKNIVDGKNVLTQEMINEANTVYEIRYDFDLNGAEITIPQKVILNFNGGSIKKGILRGSKTKINDNVNNIFGEDLILSGSWDLSYIYPEMFYDTITVYPDWFSGDNDEDNTNSINRSIYSSYVLGIPIELYNSKVYLVSDVIRVLPNVTIKGNNATIKRKDNSLLEGTDESPAGVYYFRNDIIRAYNWIEEDYKAPSSFNDVIENICISDLIIDGNLEGNTHITKNNGSWQGGWGLYLKYCNNCKVNNVKIHSCIDGGCMMSICTNCNLNNIECYNNAIQGLYGGTYFGTGNGFDVINPISDDFVNNIIFNNCKSHHNADCGFHFGALDTVILNNCISGYNGKAVSHGVSYEFGENDLRISKNIKNLSFKSCISEHEGEGNTNKTFVSPAFYHNGLTTVENLLIEDCIARNTKGGCVIMLSSPQTLNACIKNLYIENWNPIIADVSWCRMLIQLDNTSSEKNNLLQINIDGLYITDGDNNEEAYTYIINHNGGVHNISLKNVYHTSNNTIPYLVNFVRSNFNHYELCNIYLGKFASLCRFENTIYHTDIESIFNINNIYIKYLSSSLIRCESSVPDDFLKFININNINVYDGKVGIAASKVRKLIIGSFNIPNDTYFIERPVGYISKSNNIPNGTIYSPSNKDFIQSIDKSSGLLGNVYTKNQWNSLYAIKSLKISTNADFKENDFQYIKLGSFNWDEERHFDFYCLIGSQIGFYRVFQASESIYIKALDKYGRTQDEWIYPEIKVKLIDGYTQNYDIFIKCYKNTTVIINCASIFSYMLLKGEIYDKNIEIDGTLKSVIVVKYGETLPRIVGVDGLTILDTNKEKPLFSVNNKWVDANGNNANTVYNGNTTERPSNVNVGFQYFDATLNKPIWWTGSQWVDATGESV